MKTYVCMYVWCGMLWCGWHKNVAYTYVQKIQTVAGAEYGRVDGGSLNYKILRS